jgi:phosphate transport system substrate-binding protein
VRSASVTNSHSSAVTNPISQFGAITVPVNLVYDVGIANALSAQGRPLITPLSTTHQCIAVVDPATYADPATGYPIIAVTYLLANRQGNGTDLAAMRTLLGTPYNATFRAHITRIGRTGSGYEWLSNSALTQAKVDSCIAN